MPGFELTRFVGLSEREAKHLICSICLNIFDNAVNSECGHIFCKDCVQQWIADNHKECPECRKEFATVQIGRLSDSQIAIGHHQFTRSLKINTIISELKIKCDFESNGCQVLVELGLHSAHVRNCPHRFCKICKIGIDSQSEHGCLDFPKKIEELSLKLSRVEKELSEKIAFLQIENSALRNRVFWLESGLTESPALMDVNNSLSGLRINTFQVLFGTYSQKGYFIDFDHFERMIFTMRTENIPRFFLEIDNIWEVMYCTDSSFPLIILSINHFINNLIRNRIGLFSPENGWFNVISEEPGEKYIIIQLVSHKSDITTMKLLIQRLAKRQDRHSRALSSEEAHRMLDRALRVNHEN